MSVSHPALYCESDDNVRRTRDVVQTEWPFQQDIFPHLRFKVGLSYCFNRNCSLTYCPHPSAAETSSDKTEKPQKTEKSATSAPVKTSGIEGVAGVCSLQTQPALRSWQEARVTPDGESLVFMSHEQVRII